MIKKKQTKQKTKKNSIAKQSNTKNQKSVFKTYVLFGFNETDFETTGYLKINDVANGISGIYSTVNNIKLATRFTDKNITNRKGFAPPEKWIDFFKKEDELSNWNFHLVAVKNNK